MQKAGQCTAKQIITCSTLHMAPQERSQALADLRLLEEQMAEAQRRAAAAQAEEEALRTKALHWREECGRAELARDRLVAAQEQAQRVGAAVAVHGLLLFCLGGPDSQGTEARSVGRPSWHTTGRWPLNSMLKAWALKLLMRSAVHGLLSIPLSGWRTAQDDGQHQTAAELCCAGYILRFKPAQCWQRPAGSLQLCVKREDTRHTVLHRACMLPVRPLILQDTTDAHCCIVKDTSGAEHQTLEDCCCSRTAAGMGEVATSCRPSDPSKLPL